MNQNNKNDKDVGFNPTLVRLRVPGEVLIRGVIAQFQSHAGSIEGWVLRRPCIPIHPFQSHAGSIEGGVVVTPEGPALLVSIPRWFD